MHFTRSFIICNAKTHHAQRNVFHTNLADKILPMEVCGHPLLSIGLHAQDGIVTKIDLTIDKHIFSVKISYEQSITVRFDNGVEFLSVMDEVPPDGVPYPAEYDYVKELRVKNRDAFRFILSMGNEHIQHVSVKSAELLSALAAELIDRFFHHELELMPLLKYS